MRHQKGSRVLGEGITVSNDSLVTRLNNNDMLIGTSGAGKTRGYVMPNILRTEDESIFVSDTKGELAKKLGPVLRERGYRVLTLDFVDCEKSEVGYNPMEAIRYDPETGRYSSQDVVKLAATLCPIEHIKDPFWDIATRQYLSCIMGYVLSCLPREEHNLSSVQILLSQMGDRGAFDELMRELKLMDPSNFAVLQYDMIKTSSEADRMVASIRGIASEKLAIYSLESVQAMFHNPEKVDFRRMRKEKTALFVNVSDTDRSMDSLIRTFYTEAINVLCSTEEPEDEREIYLPIRFYLDDFAANYRIENFDQITSVTRSRYLGFSVILQSISQLESRYTPAGAQTILNNFDHLLFLGGMDVNTYRYIGTKADRSIGTIQSMPLDHAWLFSRGSKPQLIKKSDCSVIPGLEEKQPVQEAEYPEMPF